MRQHPFLDLRGTRSAQLTTLSYDYADADLVPEHFHDTDQLVFASTGVMTVQTKHGIWVVPPRRAVWIPVHCGSRNSCWNPLASPHRWRKSAGTVARANVRSSDCFWRKLNSHWEDGGSRRGFFTASA